MPIAGAYAGNKVRVIVTDGTLTIGVKKETEVDGDWAIFDNFELTYFGEGNIEIPQQQGSTVQAIQYFTLTVDSDKTITQGSKANETSVKLINKDDNSVVASGKTIIKDNKTVEITLDKKISVAGAYRLEIPAGELCYTSGSIKAFSSDNLFSSMQQLEQVSFCQDLNTIGAGLFHDCPNLLVVKWNNPNTLSSQYFDAPEDMGNLIVYVPEGGRSTYQGNVVIGEMAESIALTDKKPFRCPEAFKAKFVAYTRSFSKTTTPGAEGGWETIVLPFDVESISSEEKGMLAPFNSGNTGARPFWLAELNGDFYYATSIKANWPYIIAMPNSNEYQEEFNIRGNVTFSAADANDGVVVEATSTASHSKGIDFDLVPVYETMPQGSAVYAINNSRYNNLNPGAVFVRDSREVNPFEAYVRSLSNQISSPLYYSIGNGMGEVNGIEQLYRHAFDGVKAYSRNGVLYVESPCSQTLGLYAADGRLVRLMSLSEGLNRECGVAKGIYFIGRIKVMVK